MKKSFVFMLAAALVVALSAPAFAAEGPGFNTSFGGRIIVDFAYQWTSKEATANGDDDIVDNFIDVNGHSYFKAVFTSDDKKVGLRTEIGLKPTVGWRYCYGWWNIGGGLKLLAGNSDTWMDTGAAFDEKLSPIEDLGWYGYSDTNRDPEIWMEYDGGGVFAMQFGLRNPTPPVPVTPVGRLPMAGVDEYNTIPGVWFAAKVKTSMFTVTPGMYYAMVSYEGLDSHYDDTNHEWEVNLPVELNLGMFSMVLAAHYGANLAGDFSDRALSTAVVKSDGSFEDTYQFGGLVSFKFSFGPAAVSFGAGFENYTNDEWKDTLGYKNDDYTVVGYYITVPYQVHKYFTLRPEFVYLANGENPADGEDMGDEWFLGVEFRFQF